jgi:choline dehydrogenase-like flavoprotein
MSNKVYDFIVIGSGAGGAPIAHTMAKQGKSVLVLEKGPFFGTQSDYGNNRSSFKRDEMISDGVEKILNLPDVANNGSAYYSSHVEPDISDEPHIYRDEQGVDRGTIEGYTANVIGGGTQLYGGVSLRFTPRDLTLASFNQHRSVPADPQGDVQKNARNWPFSYSELEPYYTRAELALGISGTQENQIKQFSDAASYQPPLKPNGISVFAHEGFRRLGEQIAPKAPRLPYRTPLAVITRDHAPSGRKVPSDPELAKTSFINRYGDPLGLKSNTWVTLLRPIVGNTDIEILCNCNVTRFGTTAARVDRVFYLNPDGQEEWAEGRCVIVACSAIETVRLLKIAAQFDPSFDQRINQNDLLGKYFLTHALCGASAIMPGRYDKSRALDADWASDCCGEDDFLHEHGLWAGGVLYNNTSDSALPLALLRTHGSMDLDTLWEGFRQDPSLSGQGLINFFDQSFGRMLSVTCMANQVPMSTNRIELHPRIKDKWGRPAAYVIKKWHPHDIYLMNTMAELCGRVLMMGAAAIGGSRHFHGPYKFLGQGSVYQSPNGIARMANHILGGARFGEKEDDSVLDRNCRAWHFDNLFVTDGSWMPTSGGANPTLTIQANSFRIAEILKTF